MAEKKSWGKNFDCAASDRTPFRIWYGFTEEQAEAFRK
jgi:hypothetical protein